MREFIDSTFLLLIIVFLLPLTSLPKSQDAHGVFVRIVQTRIDLSPNGVTANDCIVVQGNGRFHLERRLQQLPDAATRVTVFESKLTKVQRQALREILDQHSIRNLPEFEAPVPPLGVTDFSLLVAEVNRQTAMQRIGYFSWQGNPMPGAPPESTPDRIKKAWQDSQEALQPLEAWRHALEGQKMQPSKASATLCGGNI